MADWQSGLDDDQAITGRSVVSPLDAMGIDPDDALTNRAEVMARLNQSPIQQMQNAYRAQAPMQPSATAAGAMGGAGTPPAATPPPTPAPTSAAVSPTGSSGPGKSLQDFGVAGLTGLQRNLDHATAVTEQTPTEDTQSESLESQLATDTASRPQAYDPQTGKLNAPYKPSGWQKFGRGVEGAVLGLAGGGIPGAIVGAIKPGATGSTDYGAPTAEYGHEVDANDRLVANDSQQLTASQARFKSMQDARKAQAADFRADAGLGKDLTTGAASLENAATDSTTKPIQAQADLQKAQNSDPNTKLQLSSGQFDQRTQQANRLGLKGTNRSLYILNGKVPDPRQATAEEIATGQAEKIFRQQYGRGPQTIEEFGKIEQMARGQQDKAATGGGANDRALLRSTEKHLETLQKIAKDPFAKQSMPDIDDQLKEAQQAYDEAKQSTSGASGAETGGSNKKPPAPKVGSTVQVDGKPAKVVGINPKTGKAIVSRM